MNTVSNVQLKRLAMSVANGTSFEEMSTVSSGIPETTLHQFYSLQLIARAFRESATPCHEKIGGRARTRQKSKRWKHLEILGSLGSGGFGDVFLAFDPSLKRKVALKLEPIAKTKQRSIGSNLLEEGRQLARVRHPNVLTVHGVGSYRGRSGIWMEYVEGTNLEEALSTNGLFDSREACLVGIDLCRALSAVHAHGILHRDIKPANVLREYGGRIVLIDFGLAAKSAGMDFSESRFVQAGTPAYMAPEVLAGKEATVQSEVYSLGVLLYHLVTERYPDALRTTGGRIDDGRSSRAHAVSGRVPASFMRLIDRSLARNPRDRYRSMVEVELGLVECLDLLAVSFRCS